MLGVVLSSSVEYSDSWRPFELANAPKFRKHQPIKTNLRYTECQIYKRRWLMLFLFVIYSMSNAMQWVQYSIIENVVTRYYGLEPTSSWIEWTSMIYMLTYIFFIIPGSWALDKFGMRKCVLIGAGGTCLGAWIKVLSLSPNLFYVGFIGQTIVGLSQVFVLSVPARLAAVWFGSNQVSSACSIGVFGNQLGIAVGFLLPPMIVSNDEEIDKIGSQLGLMFKGVAGFTSVLLILIAIFYEEKPPLPPSLAALKQSEREQDFLGSLKRLATNLGYILLLLSYGINVGIFYAISTLLNRVILSYYEKAEEDAGRLGVLMVISGMLGSVVCGMVLDWTHKFKETTVVVYFLSLVGMVIYTVTLGYDIYIVYLTLAFLGFAMTGYLPVGFELAAELTYPEPEGTSVGILNGVTQVFGLILTSGYSALISRFSVNVATLGLCAVLGVGLALTALVPPKLRRQEAKA
ncbi:heme transporter FLVCR2 isoform X2 [Halyomorpha halys]